MPGEIYYLYLFFSGIRAARRGRRLTDHDRRASQPHRAAQRNEPLNNLNENKIILTSKEGANKQVISSQADSLIKISRIWADF
ncbi:hypothetical protein, partial [Klebsiella quasipneumoniae]|uniref:hypothetical protein n=1 Tax=Klebsiella quasipneumoniae TaxID=1463165 RepID=UPI001C52E4BF